jgi:hypothetical protein
MGRNLRVSTSGQFYTLKPAPHAGPLHHTKSQNTTRPADPEEAPSEPTPEPTSEHLVGHPNLPTQKNTARYSADPQCLSIFQCRLLF